MERTYSRYRNAAAKDRALRKEWREQKRKRGTKTAKPTYYYCVQPQTMDVPDWAKRVAIKELTCTDEVVWLRQGHKNTLRRQDGGHAVITCCEYRRCKTCGKLFLGILAEARRKKDEHGWFGRQLPCDDGCTQRAWLKKGIKCQK